MLADYADALGAATNSLEGKPTELINRALKADPTQWKALALAGTVAFNHKDFKQAVAYWEQLKTTLPPESDMARSIASSIAEARELGGIKTAAASATASPRRPPSPPRRALHRSSPRRRRRPRPLRARRRAARSAAPSR